MYVVRKYPHVLKYSHVVHRYPYVVYMSVFIQMSSYNVISYLLVGRRLRNQGLEDK